MQIELNEERAEIIANVIAYNYEQASAEDVIKLIEAITDSWGFTLGETNIKNLKALLAAKEEVETIDENQEEEQNAE